MSTTDELDEYGRKPRETLRHWSTYETQGAYWEDYRGYVPLQFMVAITQLTKREGLTFRQAYRRLSPADRDYPIPEDTQPAAQRSGSEPL